MSEKLIEFTEEEKNQIIQTILIMANASVAEGNTFIKVCEDYGFNPLHKDIIFNKYEGKFGPRISYMVTKDAWIKHAKRQGDFVKLHHNVVYENDEFEVDAFKGQILKHKFGVNRGNVVGAWAQLETKNATFVEFTMLAEYMNAEFAQKNKLWREVPARMIAKAAISNVIKNVYPLGLVFQNEGELDIDQDYNNVQSTSIINTEEPVQIVPVAEPKTMENISVVHKKEDAAVVTEAPKTTSNEEKSPEENLTDTTKPVTEDKVPGATFEQPSNEDIQKLEQPTEEIITDPINTECHEEKSVEDSNVYTFIKKVLRLSNQTGKPTTAVDALKNGKEETLYAVDDLLEAFDGYVKGDKFTCTIDVKFNTLNFVTSVQKI